MMDDGKPKRRQSLRIYPWIKASVLLGSGVIFAVILIVVVIIALYLTQGFGPEATHPWATATPTRSEPRLPEPVFASAMAISGDAMTIRWEPVKGAHRYTISFWKNESPPGSGFLKRDGTRNTSYTVDGLVPGVEYTFGVRAHGDESRYRPSERAEVAVQISPVDGTGEGGGAGSDE